MRYLLITITLFTASACAAQPGTPPKDYVKPSLSATIEDRAPLFMGDINRYWQNHITYPATSTHTNINDTVFIECIISLEGDVTVPRITRSTDTALNTEALRVATYMRWSPAVMNKHPVEQKITIAVPFYRSSK